MKERNSGIELYRIFCMFGIVFLHCAQQSVGEFCWQRNIFKFCVDGFAFISGYYGIKSFKVKKVLNLYFVAACCIALSELIMIDGHVSSISWIRMYHCLCRLWFLHAYVILMVLAPLINLVAESKNHVKSLVSFCAIILVWGTLSELPAIGARMIHTSGIGSFSGLTLAAVYAVGRVYGIYRISERIKLKWVLAVIPFLIFINCIGAPSLQTGEWVSGWLGNYASPFCVLLAACGFYMFNRISISRYVGKIVVFLAASMFPVYVIHQHPLFWDWILHTAADIKAMGGGCYTWGKLQLRYLGVVFYLILFVEYFCDVFSPCFPSLEGRVVCHEKDIR